MGESVHGKCCAGASLFPSVLVRFHVHRSDFIFNPKTHNIIAKGVK